MSSNTTQLSTVPVFSPIKWFTACLLAALGFAQPVSALPEDADQPIHGTYDNSMLLLDEDKQIFYGSPDTPAEITQGSLKITGQEITIERIDGEVKKVTVTGSPAHYEQQPAADQSLVTAEGLTIILDYDSQHMSAIDQVKFIQEGALWSGCQVDYFMEARRVTTPTCENGERAKVVLPPKSAQ